MYETPDIFELGDVEELTHGKPFGTWSDGTLEGWTVHWVTDEVEDEEH